MVISLSSKSSENLSGAGSSSFVEVSLEQELRRAAPEAVRTVLRKKVRRFMDWILKELLFGIFKN